MLNYHAVVVAVVGVPRETPAYHPRHLRRPLLVTTLQQKMLVVGAADCDDDDQLPSAVVAGDVADGACVWTVDRPVAAVAVVQQLFNKETIII